jgi:transposase, IS30 family
MPVAVRREIVRRVRSGESWEAVAAASSVTIRTVGRMMQDSGGMPPRWKDRSPLRLSLDEREEISRGVQAGESMRSIAARLRRSVSTISDEIALHGGLESYRAAAADRAAYGAARRSKPTKFEASPRLRAYVEAKLAEDWSPQQISERMLIDHPDDEEMRVSPETIYKALYVHPKGGLRKDLVKALRSGRTRRRPHSRTTLAKQGRITNMVMISERPAEVEDRAVPGHWEGDLIIGAGGRSAVGTLVERTFRLVLLLQLTDRTTDTVTAAIQRQIATLPDQLVRSLTWDQGKELAAHQLFTVLSGIPVYFCDPHSPWQRGTNENTNGLLRQYLPKGVDLSTYTQADLDGIAAKLNSRPRHVLDYLTPSEAYTRIVRLTA